MENRSEKSALPLLVVLVFWMAAGTVALRADTVRQPLGAGAPSVDGLGLRGSPVRSGRFRATAPPRAPGPGAGQAPRRGVAPRPQGPAARGRHRLPRVRAPDTVSVR